VYTSTAKYRVLYADTDQMGFMYYGQYAKLFEIGRVEALRALGVSYAEIENQGLWMPVYELESKYLEPAIYDAVLEIKTTIKELPKARIVFFSEIYIENKLIHTAKVTLVFIRQTDRKLQMCPDIILAKLGPFFNA
jgi:acyl-CoA thioester hydrolase